MPDGSPPSSTVPGQLVDAKLGRVAFAPAVGWEPEVVRYLIESKVTSELSDDRSAARAVLTAQLKWHRHSDDEPVEGPFDLEIDVIGEFNWGFPDRTDEDIQGWIEFNSEHLLWPYLRAYISMITASAGLPVLTIYTITAPTPTLGLKEDALVEALKDSLERAVSSRSEESAEPQGQ